MIFDNLFKFINYYFFYHEINYSYKNLTSLPKLPDTLYALFCLDNKIMHVPKINKNLKSTMIDFKLFGKIHKFINTEKYKKFYNKYKNIMFILTKLKLHKYIIRKLITNHFIF